MRLQWPWTAAKARKRKKEREAAAENEAQAAREREARETYERHQREVEQSRRRQSEAPLVPREPSTAYVQVPNAAPPVQPAPAPGGLEDDIQFMPNLVMPSSARTQTQSQTQTFRSQVGASTTQTTRTQPSYAPSFMATASSAHHPASNPDLMTGPSVPSSTLARPPASRVEDGRWDADPLPAPEASDYLDSFIPPAPPSETAVGQRAQPDDAWSKVSDYWERAPSEPHQLPEFDIATGDPSCPYVEFPTRKGRSTTPRKPHRGPLALPDPASVFDDPAAEYPTTLPALTHIYSGGAAPAHFGYVPFMPINPVPRAGPPPPSYRPPVPDLWFQSYAQGHTKVPPPPLPHYRHPQPPWAALVPPA